MVDALDRWRACALRGRASRPTASRRLRHLRADARSGGMAPACAQRLLPIRRSARQLGQPEDVSSADRTLLAARPATAQPTRTTQRGAPDSIIQPLAHSTPAGCIPTRACALTPCIRAGCVSSARTDPRGERSAMFVPTATHFPPCAGRYCLNASHQFNGLTKMITSPRLRRCCGLTARIGRSNTMLENLFRRVVHYRQPRVVGFA